MSSDPSDSGPTLFDMKDPLRLSMAKGLLRVFGKTGLGVERLWHLACRLVRAKGSPIPADLREPLGVLTDSLEADARLNVMGRWSARNMLVWQMATRLQVDQTFDANPEIRSTQLPSTLVVVGLPRTGTTLLHRLLAQDPTTRAPQLWEMFFPVMDPTRFRGFPRLRKAAAKNTLNGMRWWMHQLDQVHPTHYDRPEECIFLLARTFLCEQFYMLLGDVRGYLDWTRDQDFTAAYVHYADQLRLLVAQAPGPRLVLKAPEHLAHLDALLAALPEARVVWLHRRPSDVVASFCSLVGMYHKIVSDDCEPSTLGPHILNRMADWIERGRASSAGDERVMHVAYLDSVGDPQGTVERVHAHWGQSLVGETQDSMRRWIAANPRHKHGRHRYTLEEFSLDQDQVNQRFDDYGGWMADLLSL